MSQRLILILLLAMSAITKAGASDVFPSWMNGTMMPIDTAAIDFQYPDTLKPIFVNHIGRHGARFLSSERKMSDLKKFLDKAVVEGTLSDKGKVFVRLIDSVSRKTDGRWGALDKLGKSEERTIGRHLSKSFPELFIHGRVKAVSSYVPRCVMSMYEFCHELNTLNPQIEISTKEGSSTDRLLRFFTVDTAFTDYLSHGEWRECYDRFMKKNVPAAPARSLLNGGKTSGKDLQSISMGMYGILQSLKAAGIKADPSVWFTRKQYLKCWEVSNMKHYLQRSGNLISGIPAKASAPLLENIICVADSVLSGNKKLTAMLRFGHAETLIPLLSLMDIPGCNFTGKDIEKVSSEWKDYRISPLAANLVIACFRSASGKIYAITYLNGKATAPIKGDCNTVIPWERLKEYWHKKLVGI